MGSLDSLSSNDDWSDGELIGQIRFKLILSDMMFWWIILAHMAFAHLEVDEAASHGLHLDGLLRFVWMRVLIHFHLNPGIHGDYRS